MGWKHRDWFLGLDQQAVFDRAGNIGPTVWWNGEIIGSWAITAAGDLRTRLLVDRGAAAAAAIDTAAAHLQRRLNGATVTPAVRTPLESSITRDHGYGVLLPVASDAAGRDEARGAGSGTRSSQISRQ
jgi:hypothetical protein